MSRRSRRVSSAATTSAAASSAASRGGASAVSPMGVPASTSVPVTRPILAARPRHQDPAGAARTAGPGSAPRPPSHALGRCARRAQPRSLRWRGDAVTPRPTPSRAEPPAAAAAPVAAAAAPLRLRGPRRGPTSGSGWCRRSPSRAPRCGRRSGVPPAMAARARTLDRLGRAAAGHAGRRADCGSGTWAARTTVIFDETYYAKDAWSLLQFGYEGNWPKDANTEILAAPAAHPAHRRRVATWCTRRSASG